MDRIYQADASVTPPTIPGSPSSGYPTNGNPSTGDPATLPGAYWYHMITEEIRAVIVQGGLSPAGGTLNQLKTAIQNIVAAGISSGSMGWSAITGKPTEFPPSAHTQDWSTISGKPSTFTPSAHTHDDRYYTETEIDALVNGIGGMQSNAQGWYIHLPGGAIIQGGNITITGSPGTVNITAEAQLPIAWPNGYKNGQATDTGDFCHNLSVSAGLSTHALTHIWVHAPAWVIDQLAATSPGIIPRPTVVAQWIAVGY